MRIRKNKDLAGDSREPEDFEEIRYKYNAMGKISEKLFPEEMRTSWLYDERAKLAELVHEDRHGILDRYQYDSMGNKTAITKDRRGLREESGRYEYGYDALSRLISVSRDGNALRNYAYDSFGNRSYLEDFEKGRNIFYHYDAMNRLVFAEEEQTGGMAENLIRTDYSYDNRGNLIREETGGTLIHGYEYGAMNRLSKSWDDKGQEAIYLYNGLGQRTGKNANGDAEDYLLDLTRGYHNLIGIQKGESKQHFYFDGKVTAMEENGSRKNPAGRTAFSGLHYYLQDELGSPMRVSGFCRQDVSFMGRSDYLTYGYDEFGNDLGGEPDNAEVHSPYDKQGTGQPFGFTGYRHDEVSGTCFAQAREYQPIDGRFVAKDVIKGNRTALVTLNQYGYCWGNPLAYVDKNGMQPEEDKDESLEWMENRGHSYWYTPQGLHEGNTALPLDSDKLRMSEQGKEVLKEYELDVNLAWNENIVVKDEVTGEVVAVYPYYVGDGGITFGIGHYMNYNEVMNDPDERELFTKYVSETIDPDIFDDGLGLKAKPRPVPNSKPVPLEEIEELFEKDVDGMAEDMLLNFENRNLVLTIQQLDALILIRFNTGYLGSDLTKLVENGASREEWDKVITSQSSDRKKRAKEIYWGNIFSYSDDKPNGEECAE